MSGAEDDPRELGRLWERYEFFRARVSTETTCVVVDDNELADAKRRCREALRAYVDHFMKLSAERLGKG